MNDIWRVIIVVYVEAIQSIPNSGASVGLQRQLPRVPAGADARQAGAGLAGAHHLQELVDDKPGCRIQGDLLRKRYILYHPLRQRRQTPRTRCRPHRPAQLDQGTGLYCRGDKPEVQVAEGDLHGQGEGGEEESDV